MEDNASKRRQDVGARNWRVGDVFLRDGDSAEHKVLACGENGLTVLVRRQGWGLARSFQYFMDSRVSEGQTPVDMFRDVRGKS
jgi:hypothetical protein